MFCKKCGSQIADDSDFCSKCGAKQNEQSETKQYVTIEIPQYKQKYCSNCGAKVYDNEIICRNCNEIIEETDIKPLKVTKPKKSGCFVALLILAAIIITIILLINTVANYKRDGNYKNDNNTNSGINILKRNATINDLEISENIDLKELSYMLYITAKSDIKDLELTLNFYDKNDDLLKSKTITLGDLKEGEQIKRNIPITDFPNIFKLDKVSIMVSDGTVSYLQ